MSRNAITAAVLGLVLLSGWAAPANPQAEFERGFTETVKPFLETYCTACHGGPSPAAQFNLRKYATLPTVIGDIDHWSR